LALIWIKRTATKCSTLAGEPLSARLERICEPTGITISRLVYDRIDGKLALRFRNLGPQKLKNVPKPIDVFAIDQSSESDEAVERERTKAVQTILPSA
jgi:class 3 adenylate cyclase